LKGVVFTTDAVFALLIVSLAITIIAYFNYSVSAPYSAVSSSTQSVLSTLGSTPFSSAGSDMVAYSILNAHNASGESWTQYHGSLSESNYVAYGPSLPDIAFIYTANAPISTKIVSGYGNVYFGTATNVYALNATTGALAWTFPVTGVTGFTLYDNMLLYYNSTGMGTLSANNGTKIWTSQTHATQVVAYNNYLYAIYNTSLEDPNLYILGAQNGTLLSSISISANLSGITVSNGTLLLFYNTNISTLNTGGGIINSAYSVANTNLTAVDGYIYTGFAVTEACSFYMNLTERFCTLQAANFTGAAADSNIIIVENINGTEAYLQSGTLIWNATLTPYGAALLYPILTNSSVYSIWSNNYLVDQNASTGNVLWSTQVPSTYGSISQMSAGYGNIYLSAGDKLIAYGACTSQVYKSVLQEAVQLYLQGDGSCATYILSRSYNASNYGLFINNMYAPSLNVSSFSGTGSYAYANLGAYFGENKPLTASVWAYLSPSTNGPLFGVASSPPGSGWNMPFISADGLTVYGWIWVNSQMSYTAPSPGWYMLTLTYNSSGSGTEIFYVNGAEVANVIGQYSPSGATDYWTTYISGSKPSGVNTYLTGDIADVQAYESILNATDISKLYSEGIGGSPIPGAHNTGWWLLEGDTNDYSGYNNTAYPENIAYVPGNYVPAGLSSAYGISVASVLLPFNMHQGFNGGNSIYSNKPKLYKVSVYSWN
jgi:outer membrane protein assembly factor BamB